MRIIALIGDANTGKTETLNRLGCILHQNGWNCRNHGRAMTVETMCRTRNFKSHAKRLFEKNGESIGICPDGDSIDILRKNFAYLNRNHPKTGFVAVRDTQPLNQEFEELIQRYNFSRQDCYQEHRGEYERGDYNQTQAEMLYNLMLNSLA